MNLDVIALGFQVSENGGLDTEEEAGEKAEGENGQRAGEGHLEWRARQVHRGKDWHAGVCTLGQPCLCWSSALPGCSYLSGRATPEEGNKPANEDHGKIHHLAKTYGDFIPYQMPVSITPALVLEASRESRMVGTVPPTNIQFSFGDHVHLAAVGCPVNRNGSRTHGLLFRHIVMYVIYKVYTLPSKYTYTYASIRFIHVYVCTWMSIKYQINVKLTLFVLLNNVVGRRGVGMMAFCTEGLVTQGSGFFSLSNIWSGIITAFSMFLDILLPFRNAQRWKILFRCYNLPPLLPGQERSA